MESPLNRRYQVFVSSTFEDLVEERRHVIQALLETKCIPCGMELFPASSTSQWEMIKKLIDDCDYYIVIVAGRYGSMSESGRSYTEMEFDYAESMGKPVIGFYHGDVLSLPGKRIERSESQRSRLELFTDKVKSRLCRAWLTPEGLGSAIKSAMLSEIEFNPQPGWIRANSQISLEVVQKLKQRIADLEEAKKQSDLTVDLPDDHEEIAVECEVSYNKKALMSDGITPTHYLRKRNLTISIPFNQLFLPIGIKAEKRKCNKSALKLCIDNALAPDLQRPAMTLLGKEEEFCHCRLASPFFSSFLNTLVAKKYLKRVAAPKKVRTSDMYWQIAPKGITKLASLRSIRRAFP